VKVHLIAACGVGMSGLATLLRAAGHEVTGSDENVYPPASTLLETLGVTVHQGFDPARLEGVDLVVCGNAVPRTNPEAAAAHARELPTMSFPQAVAELFLPGRRSFVVAGTHGKTTSASMLAFVLQRCGRDPGWLIGGAPLDLGANAAIGGGEIFVIEGDEYDSAWFDKGPKFLHYRPAAVLLGAVEFDHADIYRDLEAVKQAFRRLLALVPAAGALAVCGDFPHALGVVAAAGGHARVRQYGLGTDNPWRITDLADDGDRTRALVRERGRVVAELVLRVPGAINARNALGVLLLAEEAGLGLGEAAEALAEFRGVARRQQLVADIRGVTVIDDFAHHPTAVAGTIAALRLRYPGRRLRAVFEPRSNTSRRRVFQQQFADALATADEAVLAGVFSKPNDPIPPEERLSPETIAAEVRSRGIPARMIVGVPAICDYLVASAVPGDVIVIMSNGAFGGLPALVAEGLAA